MVLFFLDRRHLDRLSHDMAAPENPVFVVLLMSYLSTMYVSFCPHGQFHLNDLEEASGLEQIAEYQ